MLAGERQPVAERCEGQALVRRRLVPDEVERLAGKRDRLGRVPVADGEPRAKDLDLDGVLHGRMRPEELVGMVEMPLTPGDVAA